MLNLFFLPIRMDIIEKVIILYYNKKRNMVVLTTKEKENYSMKKSALSVLLALILVFSLTTSVFAATKAKTVTFNGGYIYKTEKGKPGSAQVKISNIVKTKKNVKISEKTLIKNYTETEDLANTFFGYDENYEEITLKDIVTANGVTEFHADKAPVTVTAKTALSCFWACYAGDEEKATYTPKYYSYNDYLKDQTKAKVLKDMPEGDYLLAPGTKIKLTKPGKFLFVIADDGTIDGSPFSAFCVIIK